MLKIERIRPTRKSHEFEEKLRKATKPKKNQNMLLSNGEKNRVLAFS